LLRCPVSGPRVVGSIVVIVAVVVVAVVIGGGAFGRIRPSDL
jgi:hypothetical protein